MDKHEIEADRAEELRRDHADHLEAVYESNALTQMSDYQSVVDALDCMTDDLPSLTGEIAELFIRDRKYLAKPKTELEKAVFAMLVELEEEYK